MNKPGSVLGELVLPGFHSMTTTARAVRLASFHGRPAAVAPTRRIGQPARWAQRAVSGGGLPEAGGLWAAAKRAAGTAEGWLRSQAVAGSKQIFLFNLKGKLDRIDEARGMTHLYLQRIREGAERLESDAVLQKTDERSLYHIQTACLLLAALRVLTQQLRMSNTDAIACIRECLGDADSAGGRAVEKLTVLSSWLMVKAQQGSEASALIKTAHNMSEVDFGSSFSVTHEDSPKSHVATVSRCFYHDFFTAHGAPELTREIFCRADEALFEKSTGFDLDVLKKKGVFQVQSTIADGHPTCRFVIKKPARTEGNGKEATGEGPRIDEA